MKSLGHVISISKGKLLIRTERKLREREKIFDESGNFVGTVLEIFGPVERPYVLISPKKEPTHYMGKELFV